jgi:hypothetical protein
MCEIGDTHLGKLLPGIVENRTVSSWNPQPCLPQDTSAICEEKAVNSHSLREEFNLETE